MKTTIDLDANFLTLFMLNKAFKAKFKKYWGTTMIDGVEVFNEKYYYYPNTSNTAIQKMLTVLGMKTTINSGVSEYQGIDSAWLLLNPDKVPTAQTLASAKILLASVIENNFDAGRVYKASLNFDCTAAMSNFYANGVFNKAACIVYYNAHLKDIVDSSVLSSVDLDEEEETPSRLVKYVALDTARDVFAWSIDNAQITLASTKATSTRAGMWLSLSIERTALVVDGKDNYLTLLYNLLERPAAKIDAGWIYSTDSDATTNVLWYKDYLRVSAMNLPQSKFTKVVMVALDTGYKKKKQKSSWWKKLLSIVIVVVITWLSWGAAGGAAAAAANTMATVSLAATYAAIGLALAQYAASQAGWTDVVGYLGKFVKVVGVVATVTGVAALATKLATSTVAEAVKQQFAKATSFTLANTAKYVGMAVNMWSKNVIAGINTSVNSLQDKVNESEELLYEMYDREYNLPYEAIKWQNESLKLDQAKFEIDYLYEPTKLNICRRSFV